MSKIFGGSKQSSSSNNTASSVSESSNRAYDTINQGYAPIGQQNLEQGNRGLMEILGGGFEGYKDKTGFDFLKEIGMRGVMGQWGGRGVIGSGAAAKALQGYGQNLNKTFADSFIGHNQNLSNTGINIGQLLGGVGGVSKSNSQSRGTSTGSGNSNPGVGGFVGGLLSERSQKQNIEFLGALEDGLGIYSYEYKSDPGIMHVGTMADEVEELRPWALGERTPEGYRTVNYSKLNNRKGE